MSEQFNQKSTSEQIRAGNRARNEITNLFYEQTDRVMLEYKPQGLVTGNKYTYRAVLRGLQGEYFSIERIVDRPRFGGDTSTVTTLKNLDLEQVSQGRNMLISDQGFIFRQYGFPEFFETIHTKPNRFGRSQAYCYERDATVDELRWLASVVQGGDLLLKEDAQEVLDMLAVTSNTKMLERNFKQKQ